MAKKWIKKAIKKPGQLRKDLGIANGKKIPAAVLNKAAKPHKQIQKKSGFAMGSKKCSQRPFFNFKIAFFPPTRGKPTFGQFLDPSGGPYFS